MIPVFTRKTTQRGAATLLALCTGALAAFAVPAIQAQTTYAIVTDSNGSDQLSEMGPQLAQWRKAGLVKSMQVLKALPQQKETPGFATMAMVELPSPQAYKTWSAQVAAKLGRNATVRQADVLRQEGKPVPAPEKAVYVVNFYLPKVSATEYRTYTERYIAPNMNQQRGEGIMSRYAMLLERDTAGAKGRAMLLTEYVDDAAFAKRDEVKARGKTMLLADPQWKRINDTKDSLRDDLSSATAKAVPLTAAAH